MAQNINEITMYDKEPLKQRKPVNTENWMIRAFQSFHLISLKMQWKISVI